MDTMEETTSRERPEPGPSRASIAIFRLFTILGVMEPQVMPVAAVVLFTLMLLF